MNHKKKLPLPKAKKEAVKIVKGTLKDLPALLELSEELHLLHYKKAPYFFHPFSRQAFGAFFKKALQGKSHFLWLARGSKRLCGFSLYEAQARKESTIVKGQKYLYLDQIFVSPRIRKRGVAKRLLSFGLKEARRMGFKEVILDVWGFNDVAQSFFAAQGFKHQIHRMRRTL